MLHKVPKSDIINLCCKIQTKTSYHRIMCPKNVDGIANSEDPGKTTPIGAV